MILAGFCIVSHFMLAGILSDENHAIPEQPVMAIHAATGKLIQYTVSDSSGRFSFQVPDSLEHDNIYLLARITTKSFAGCSWKKIRAEKNTTDTLKVKTSDWPVVDIHLEGIESDKDELVVIFDPEEVTGMPAVLKSHIRTGPNNSIRIFVHQFVATGKNHTMRIAGGQYRIYAFAENIDHPDLKDKKVNGRIIRFYSMIAARGKDVTSKEKPNSGKSYLLNVTGNTKFTISLKRG
ncbi:MAG: hypothetical protein FD123_2655 [Bacteroidetes bacterium]|nr:MAG: hypothetical protein FD123_2655 [Bacteroidota bacterium]